MKPISIQLYSVRQFAENDFIGVLKRVAAIGYKGVEPAGLFNIKPAEFVKITKDLGLEISSNHGPWPTRENVNDVIDTAKVLGITTMVGGYGPDDFKTMDQLHKIAETVNFICEKLKAAGISLALHNHYWEFDMLEGRLVYDRLMELCPLIKCELDIYWAANFGACNPVEQVKKNRSRLTLMHVKDGTLIKDKAHTAVGSGKVDIAGCIAAADPKVLQWLIVELDRCDTDMWEAVEASYRFLTSKGLGKGNK